MELVRQKAERGSLEHQLLLGKQLLQDYEKSLLSEDGGAGQTALASEAVTWLMKASMKGSDEATILLQECLQKDTGINASNEEKVKLCINMPKWEKSARQAAHNMYRKLNPLKDVPMSKEEYYNQIKQFAGTSAERKLLEKAGKGSGDMTEDQFVEQVMRKLQGKGGLVLSALLGNDTEGKEWQQIPWYKKLLYYPGKTVSYISDHMVEYGAKQGMTVLKSMIPTQQIYMLLIFFVYSVVSVHFLLRIFPLFFFYFSFLSMVVCTLQMFYSRKKLNDIRAMGGMLQKFTDTLDTDSAESMYTWHSLTPYWMFFVSLLISLFSFGMADKNWIPCSELAVLALFFFASCFIGLSNKYDHLVIISVVCSVVSCLPNVIQGFPEIPVLYQVVNLLFGSWYTVEIRPDLFMNIGIPAIMYMVVPLLFVRMAMMNSWEGTYRVLIPHLVCFFWFQVAVLFFSNSTWWGLLRGSLGWVLALVLLPLLLIVGVVWLLIIIGQALSLSGILKLATTFALLAIPTGLAIWAKKGFKVQGFSFEDKKGKIILVVISIIAIIPVMVVFQPPEPELKGEYLDWPRYAEYCSKPQWDRTSIADAQLKCSHFKHLIVAWSGTVHKVVINKKENQAEAFVELFPKSISDWLKCTYGVRYPVCSEIADNYTRGLCEIESLQGTYCHMKKLDYLTFEIWVNMPVGDYTHLVRLVARHTFMKELMQIRTGDELAFRAALFGELGNTWPVLNLYHVECKSCSGDVIINLEDEDALGIHSVFTIFKRAICTTFNFFTYPILQFGAN